MFRVVGKVLAPAVIAMAAASAQAQQFYVGGGLAYVSGESDWGSPTETSELSTGAASIIVGQRYDLANSFWAIEANADLTFGAAADPIGPEECGVSASGPYLCEHKATVRIVGIYGLTTASGLDIFGSLGYGVVYGDFADDTASVGSGHVGGVTAGLGLARDIGAGAVRGELIYDNFTSANQSGGFESDYTATTARVSYIMKF